MRAINSAGNRFLLKPLITALCLFSFLITPFSLLAAAGLPYVDGEVLVKFKRHVWSDASGKSRIIKDMGAETVRHFPLNDIYLLKAAGAGPAGGIINKLKSHPDIEYAEPNYKRRLMTVTASDPFFSSQWGLQKIHVSDAWQITQGSRDIVVAFADSGIDVNHEDLKDNLWINHGEVCNNGIDDDSDGYADDCYGVNIMTGNGNPIDDEGHGTHAAGIAGAVGNNGVGISGVNWKVSLMALKFIGSDGTGTLADELLAIEYAVKRGARVFNMSYGGYELSNSEKDAIGNAVNILFVAAACNETKDNDITPCYPASFDLPNMISVAATDQTDSLAYFSNYGRNSVSVGAPGVSIKSTYPSNAYKLFSGTSMAAPFVSGLAALILSQNPNISVGQLKDRILRTVDPVAGLRGKTLTGGRINAYRALTDTITGPYIYSISPDMNSTGSEVTIRGSDFRTSQGNVTFGENVTAAVVSWSNEEIVVKVPDGAVTGAVYVTTAEGKSNEVSFDVTNYPVPMRFAFPHVSVQSGQTPLLILSNPVDKAVTVYLRIVETVSGKIASQVVSVNAFNKQILNIGSLAAAGASAFIECESQGFFGAAVVITDLANGVFVMPPITGGPLNLIGGASQQKTSASFLTGKSVK